MDEVTVKGICEIIAMAVSTITSITFAFWAIFKILGGWIDGVRFKARYKFILRENEESERRKAQLRHEEQEEASRTQD